MNQLIRCINCDELFMKTSFDQWLEYKVESPPSPESFTSIEKDDLDDFLKNHHGHQLEDLKIMEDSFVSDKPYFEPVKLSYFKATNGKENFVIKKFRETISEPLKYQFFGGDYSLHCIGIEIQTNAITKQLEMEFKERSLSSQKIEAFINLYQHIAELVDIEGLERIPEESSCPLDIYYKMDDVSLMYLLRNCRNIFKGQEYLDMEKFIHNHKEDGVLLLKGTYEIQLTEKVKSKKKAMAAPVPLEMEQIIEKKKL